MWNIRFKLYSDTIKTNNYNVQLFHFKKRKSREFKILIICQIWRFGSHCEALPANSGACFEFECFLFRIQFQLLFSASIFLTICIYRWPVVGVELKTFVFFSSLCLRRLIIMTCYVRIESVWSPTIEYV